MADHPLLPQARLRELHALMKRCRDLDRKRHTLLPAREGWLAASAMQLVAGDLLCSEPGEDAQQALAPDGAVGRRPLSESGELPPTYRLPAAAGVACGFKRSGAKALVLSFASAGTAETGWADTLNWAQRDQLPLLLACAEVRVPGRKRQGDVLTWESLSAVAQRCSLPVFPVDAEDAVAVYRVMYESVLRARDGGGPAVLWGVFGSRSRTLLSRSAQPLARLEAYLRVRGIKPSA